MRITACIVGLFAVGMASVASGITLPDDPSLAPNLKLWLQADALGLPDGTAVSTWTDSSAAGNDAVNLAGKDDPVKQSARALLPGGTMADVVHFGGTTNELLKADALFGGSGSGDLSIIAVYKTTQLSSDNRPVGFGAYLEGDTANNYNLAADPSIRKDNGKVGAGSYTHPKEFFVRSSIMTAAGAGSVQEFLNGVGVLNDGGNYTTGTDDFYLGDMRRVPTSSSYKFNFDIAEVIVYDTALAAADRQGIEEYLAEKYLSPGTVTTSATAPTDDLLESHVVTGGTNRLRTNRGTAGASKNSGQTFAHDAPFTIDAVTFLIGAQNAGEGTFDGDDDWVDVTVFRVDDGQEVFGEVFDVDINPSGQDFADGDFVTFAFGNDSPELEAGTEYGVLLSWLAGDDDHVFRIERSTTDQYPDGGHLWFDAASGSPGGFDATFFIQGQVAAVPEPATWLLAIIGLMGLALARRTGRRD